MSIINFLKRKNIIYIFIFGLLLTLPSCGLSNVLPNSERDKWYAEHPVDLGKLLAVHEGMTRSEVLEKWGNPWKVKDVDRWIYYFPDIAKEKTHVQFKNNIVVKMWTSFEVW